MSCISSAALYCVVCIRGFHIYSKALLCLFECGDDTDLLRDIDLHLLLGNPVMLVLENL